MTAHDSRGRFTSGGGGGRKAKGRVGRVTNKRGQQPRKLAGGKVTSRPLGGNRKGRSLQARPFRGREVGFRGARAGTVIAKHGFTKTANRGAKVYQGATTKGQGKVRTYNAKPIVAGVKTGRFRRR